MADLVYVLCALTSLLCATLLWRGYKRSRTRLLWASALCFVGLFLNNLMLLIDLRVLPQFDLAVWRIAPALGGVCILLYGLVLDSEIR
jgi:hypothetical protein